MSEIYQRRLFLVATFLTGATGLTYQVVWQKYLSLLIGAEARSQSLIIAFFLTGLALGYHFFGILSERIPSKNRLLKLYGYVELFIGVYAVLFPQVFQLIFESQLWGESYLLFDILLSGILILPPTFCMGATVPLLTKALPRGVTDVNKTHTFIYGLNTLGAFLGTLIGGVYLIYYFGLSITSIFAASINILVGIVFMGNRLSGKVLSENKIPEVEHPFSENFLKLLVFFSGLFIISLEVLWVRLLGLSIGSSGLIFPIILSLFVLGLGLGPLTIKEISVRSLVKTLQIAIVGQLFVYFSVPYLPLWLSHIRIILKNYPQNFFVYYSLVYFFMVMLLLPTLFFLGRILPLTYGMLSKMGNDYGKKCGHLYFLNTIGTFLGALVVGHLFLYWLNINSIYFLLIIFLVGISSYTFLLTKRRIALIVSLIFPLLILILSDWNRFYHVLGIFRERNILQEHFQGVFYLPKSLKNNPVLHYFKDGVNTTVATIETVYQGEKNLGMSLIVNGKSDGSTWGDYGTIHLLGILPYLYHEGKKLKVAIVGLGTGVTAGYLANLENVERVDVIEISPAVINAMETFGDKNYHVLSNHKVFLHEMDAFKYFKGKENVYDIIISEPTNPWTAGTEQLFSPEFFQKVGQALKDDGLFSQWVNLYAFGSKDFKTLLKNLQKSFPVLQFYELQTSDGSFLAKKKGKEFQEIVEEKWNQKEIQDVLANIGIWEKSFLSLLRHYDTDELKIIEFISEGYSHDIERPTLGLRALRAFFTGEMVNIPALHSPYYSRHILSPEKERERQETFLQNNQKIKKYAKKCKELKHDSISCKRNIELGKSYEIYKVKKTDKRSLEIRLKNYNFLRKYVFIPRDLKILNSLKKELLKKGTTSDELVFFLEELLREGFFDEARDTAKKAMEYKIFEKQQDLDIVLKKIDFKQKELDIVLKYL